ncbi:MAG: molybdopterin-synthase adenylyltransferase MoeB [Saprospiraceae bacterium]|nr:molybdopterin-synthase adenylyltransferase MoeB [Saprospiraceae bacterium]
MNFESNLKPEEYARYSRHIIIPEFGLEGQLKLKSSSVLVIGSGGLGSPVLLYLAAAGVGHIGIVDFDTVDDSNLQRQVLFTVDDLGKSKAQTAKERIQKLNPHIKVTVFEERFTKENALEIIKDFDVVADGTDNFPTRYLVNDACVLAGKVNVYASIFRFEGQVSVFNYLKEDGTRGPNYRDMFPEPPPPGLVPNCSEGGVLGVLPGIIGSLQANEVIKVLTGVGDPLVGRLFLFDAASFTTRILKVHKSPDTKIEQLINYEQFCGMDDSPDKLVKEISVHELLDYKTKGIDYQLIDVREPHEYSISHLDAALIPMGAIGESASKIAKDKPVILYCRSGIRSAKAIRELEENFGFTNLHNLKGGILAWAKEIDTSMITF